MTLILVGQNELWDKLKLQNYAAVRQRIDIKCEIPQFDRSQTESYIHSHLDYAGGNTDIFTDKAYDEIYRYSAGSARGLYSLTHVCFSKGQETHRRPYG